MLYPGARQSFYFDFYGRSGFFGHMVLIPEEDADDYVAELQSLMRRHEAPCVLAAVKRFKGRQRLLRFDGTGFSLHVHIANSAAGRALVGDLEALAVDTGAIRTPYFDAHLDAEDARRQYPEIEEFASRVRRADPDRRFRSPLARRLEL